MRSDIACVGELMWETFMSWRSFPPWDHTAVIGERAPRKLGGAVLNTASNLTQLGNRVRLVSAVGRLEREKVEALLSQRLEELCLVEGSGECDWLLAWLAASRHRSLYFLGHQEVDSAGLVDACQSIRIAVLNGGRHPCTRRAFRALADSGNYVLAFNPSYAIFEYEPLELLDLCRGVKILAVNAGEEAYLTSIGIWRELAGMVIEMGGVVITTAAREGARIRNAEMELSARPRRISADLAIGAGDAFLSGVLHSFVRGDSLGYSMSLGMALAELVVEQGEVRPEVDREDVLRRACEFGGLSTESRHVALG